MSFSDVMSLSEARAALRELVEDGHRCPCCTQFAKVYRFRINASMTVAAMRIWQHAGTDWADVSAMRLPHNLHAHLSKLRFWGILEQAEGVREDGSKRLGIWRVTHLGERWLIGAETVPSHARIYDNRCLGLTGNPTTARQALGTRFNYDELMSANGQITAGNGR